MSPSLASSPQGSFAIRAARPGDAPKIARVHAAAIEVCRGHYGGDEIDAWLATVEEACHRRAIKSHRVLVAERHRRIVAFGDVDAARGEIVHLYTCPTVAGRGIGTALLQELEAIAGDASPPTLHLRASLNAEGFYRRRGYAVTDGPRTFMLGDVDLACVPMVKAAPNGKIADS
ncbi:MAG: GNAT family N-acetyltransferase [Phycisphaerales bacterium]